MRLIHHSPYTLLANGVTEIKQQRNSTERRPKGPNSTERRPKGPYFRPAHNL